MKILTLLKIPFALFMVLYFSYLVVSSAPAAWAIWFLNKSAPGVWMSSIEGTMWKGRANSAQLIILNESPIALGQVEWTLNPFSLLALRPCISLTTTMPKQTIVGDVCHSLGSGINSVKNFSLDVPVSALQNFIPMDATGDLSVQILQGQFDASGRISELDANASWQRGRVKFDGNWLALGSFAAKVKGNGGGGAIAELFDLEGPYKVSLNGELQNYQQGWNVQGTISPQAGASDLIVQGLQILGEDLGDGSYKVQWP